MSELIADPDRPRDAVYVDFNRVPWFAKMNFAERIAHFDWLIPIWEKKLATARCAAIREHGDFMGELVVLPEDGHLRHIRDQREIVVEDRAPLRHLPWWEYKWPDGPGTPGYAGYLDSPRWKRTALRKKCSVDYRCEIPGCDARATDTHHLHYNNIGFEENGDLLATCHPHHKAQHRGWI